MSKIKFTLRNNFVKRVFDNISDSLGPLHTTRFFEWVLVSSCFRIIFLLLNLVEKTRKPEKIDAKTWKFVKFHDLKKCPLQKWKHPTSKLCLDCFNIWWLLKGWRREGSTIQIKFYIFNNSCWMAKVSDKSRIWCPVLRSAIYTQPIMNSTHIYCI